MNNMYARVQQLRELAQWARQGRDRAVQHIGTLLQTQVPLMVDHYLLTGNVPPAFARMFREEHNKALAHFPDDDDGDKLRTLIIRNVYARMMRNLQCPRSMGRTLDDTVVN